MGDMIEDECDVTLSPDFKTAQFGKDRMPTIEEIDLEWYSPAKSSGQTQQFIFNEVSTAHESSEESSSYEDEEDDEESKGWTWALTASVLLAGLSAASFTIKHLA